MASPSSWDYGARSKLAVADLNIHMAFSSPEIKKHASPGSRPRVFVGLPVYNGARFLARALNSLLAQTYGDFVLLISDNASSDATQAICEHYAESDSRVCYVRQPFNIGAPRNWNFVANQADGEYFKWATANDECSPEFIEQCVRILDADPSAVLCQGKTFLVDEETDAREPYGFDLELADPRPSQRLKDLVIKLALNNGQSGLIRLASLRRTGLDRPYPGGDIPLMAELALLGKFIVVQDVFLYRRMGPSTFSRLLRTDQMQSFYGKSSSRSLSGAQWRQHLAILWAALRLTNGWQETLAATNIALRRIIWDSQALASDVRRIAGFR
jgi:glycosyltransferase involved in cell wall biosynthesis